MEPTIPFRRNPQNLAARPPDDFYPAGDRGVESVDETLLLAPATVEALFRQSYRSIVQSLALAGGDLAAAEDATQEAFAQAWVRWGRISRYDNPAAWVRRVAINKLRNAHRSRIRGEAAVERMKLESSSGQPPREPQWDLVAGLQSLPYKQRLCAVLFYVDGLSTTEVAHAIGVSQGSVSQHLNRARTALRAYLEVSA